MSLYRTKYSYRGFTYRCEGRGHGGWWEASGPDGAALEASSAKHMRSEIDYYWQGRADAPAKIVRKVTRVRTPRVISTGGRDRKESNDCVVRAIAHARCIPYAEAHASLKEWGREDGRGTSGAVQYMDRANWARRVDYYPRTVDRFALSYPKGHYLLLIAKHALAVCDGTVYDAFAVSGLSRVQFAWEIVA